MSVFRVLGIYNFMMSQHICLEIDLFFLIIIISGVNIVGKVTCTMQKYSVWQVTVGLWQGDIEIVLDVKIEAFGMIAS